MASQFPDKADIHAPVALLVTRVEATQPLRAEEKALGIIRDEHRSIAVVVQGMRDVALEAASIGKAPDTAILERMAAYLHDFPERVYHPKEERHLHRRLRERCPAAIETLAKLEGQHREEHALLDHVGTYIEQFKAGTASDARLLAEAVDEMAGFMLKHIGHEESALLPLARQHLHEHDWIEITDAFATNNDPGLGDLPADEFRRLCIRRWPHMVMARLERRHGAPSTCLPSVSLWVAGGVYAIGSSSFSTCRQTLKTSHEKQPRFALFRCR